MIERLLESLKVGKNNRIVIYSAVTNAFDGINEPKWIRSDVDYYMFSDHRDEISSDIWNIKKIDFTYRDPRRLAKIFKLFPHYLFPNYEFSIWVDANMEIYGNLYELIKKYLIDRNKTIALCKHMKRKNIREEAIECIRTGSDKKEILKAQIDYYNKTGFPDDIQLSAGGFLLRKHNHLKCKSLMDTWWEQIDNFSSRDQLSFNFACWQQNLTPGIMEIDQHNNKYFKIHPHPQFLIYKDGDKSIINLKVLKSKLKHLITSSKVYSIIKRCVYK